MGVAFLYGVGGGKSAELQAKSVNLNLANGDQVISPDTGYDGMTSVTVICPATAIPENIKKDVVIGGITGTYEGSAIANNLDGLVDGTITSFTMPQGKTKVHRYLFYNVTSLQTANLQGATQTEDYAFYGTTNAAITLPSTLTNIAQYSFYNAGKGTAPMELNCPNAACTVGSNAFQQARISKVIGKFGSIGNYAFNSCNILTEVDMSQCDGIGSYAFAKSTGNIWILSKCHIVVNGSIGSYAFDYRSEISDLQVRGQVSSIGDGAFRNVGYGRTNPMRYLFDFSTSTFTSIGTYAFQYVQYADFYLPITCTTLNAQAFNGSVYNNIYFTTDTPPTIQSNTFANMSNTNLWVPYQKANAYRTKSNWVSVVSSVKGYAAENTFSLNDTLPEINDEGYGLTWYSDKAMTTQVTTVSDPTQKYYCTVGTTILAYKIKAVTQMDCTVSIVDTNNHSYSVNDQVLVGTVLTIDATPDTAGWTPYMFEVNGSTFTPGDTITVASDISVTALYWDGINVPINPDMGQNSWAMIKLGMQNGLGAQLWTVGKNTYKEYTGTSTGVTYRMFYADNTEGRYDYNSGGGVKSNGVLMAHVLYGTTQTTQWNPSNNSNYPSSTLFNYLHNTVKADMPTELQDLLEYVKVPVATSGSNSTIIYAASQVITPSQIELGSNSYSAAGQGTTWKYFADNNNNTSRIMQQNGTNRAYWTRSPHSGYTNYAVIVNVDGSFTYDIVYYTSRVAFAIAW